MTKINKKSGEYNQSDEPKSGTPVLGDRKCLKLRAFLSFEYKGWTESEKYQ